MAQSFCFVFSFSFSFPCFYILLLYLSWRQCIVKFIVSFCVSCGVLVSLALSGVKDDSVLKQYKLVVFLLCWKQVRLFKTENQRKGLRQCLK